VTIRVIIGIAALICAASSGIASTFLYFRMIDEVNAKLPKGEQIDPAGWYFAKTSRLHGEYRRLFPRGRLLLKIRLVTALMFVLAGVTAWGLASEVVNFN
jgi:hypothetical protein